MRTKAMLAGLAVALIAVPLVTSAATLNDLQSEFNDLLARFVSIQMQGTAAASSPAVSDSSLTGTVVPSCPAFARSLSVGSTGSDVRTLQAYLDAHGYLNVSPTGYFGALTKTAVGKWQAAGGVTAFDGAGFGVFGPLSRGYFARACGGGQAFQPFSADPRSGQAPLSVAFSTSDSIVSSSTYVVDFGDGITSVMTKGSCIAITAVVGGQGGIRCSYAVSHTYSTSGTYTARLLKQTPSKCPAGLMCAQSAAMMLPAPQVVGTATIVVSSAGSASASIQQLNAPGSVTLAQGGIAEIRNKSFYFTLNSLTSSTATIQRTPVGCWNSFPSDTPPAIRCMIAQQLIPPQTLSVGHTYASTNYGITLAQISNGFATFVITASSTQ